VLAAMKRTIDRGKIPALLPQDAIVMNKTGAIPGVEHDVAVVDLPGGHRYIIVVMSSDLSSNQAGATTIAEVSRLVYNYEQAISR
jgi:beta-lactamase class A